MTGGSGAGYDADDEDEEVEIMLGLADIVVGEIVVGGEEIIGS